MCGCGKTVIQNCCLSKINFAGVPHNFLTLMWGNQQSQSNIVEPWIFLKNRQKCRCFTVKNKKCTTLVISKKNQTTIKNKCASSFVKNINIPEFHTLILHYYLDALKCILLQLTIHHIKIIFLHFNQLFGSDTYRKFIFLTSQTSQTFLICDKNKSNIKNLSVHFLKIQHKWLFKVVLMYILQKPICMYSKIKKKSL
eukprot:TRINITY_DN1145_c0_g1_i9.p1 TRINITY_DN1145_c0_g1~~TRINITY_DN1145_c0_g1_i9.p1  ORF type:complete len:197 (+),score=-14.82 TRINITY_DN1145_c0_g1_i9:418-1008(+)